MEPQRLKRRNGRGNSSSFECDRTYPKIQCGRVCGDCQHSFTGKISKKENILLVGGTGLYLSAVSDGLSALPSANIELREQFLQRSTEDLYQELLRQDPLSATGIHPNNRVRIERALEVFALTGKSFAVLSKQNVKRNEYSFYKVALERERGKLYERIDQRVDKMIEEGLEEEVRTLYQSYGEALKNCELLVMLK